MPSLTPRPVVITTGTIVRAVLILLGLFVLWTIADIVLYVFVAMLLAGLIYPWASWAARFKIPRGLAVLAFYIFLFGVLGAAFALLVPAILQEARALLGSYGDSVGTLRDGVNGLRELFERSGFTQRGVSGLGSLSSQIQNIFGGFFGVATAVFGGLAGFLVVLVLSFYIIVEEAAVKNLFRDAIPERYQEFGAHVVWQMIQKLGGWLRGQLLLSLIIGILYFIGFTIIGVPYALLLALLGGLLEFIPYIGPFIAAIPAVFLAFTHSPTLAIMTLALIIVIQQLENNLIVPKIMQKAVGLNPIVSIVAFMIGAKTFGVAGAIFAIPIATAASVAFTEVLRYRREHDHV